MAERRMFAKTIIDSDAFLEMPQSTQLLYFHLSMRADDDGFINKPKAIMQMVGCKDDDMKLLVIKKFIIPFESGVVVVKHWKIHNYIQNDRYNETKYKLEKSMLEMDENKAYRISATPDTNCIHDVSIMETQVRLGKVRLGKDRLVVVDNPSPPPEKVYQENIGLITPIIAQSITHYLSDGITSELINKAIVIATENNKRNWKYISAILNRCLQENILTVEQYNSKEIERYSKGGGHNRGNPKNDNREDGQPIEGIGIKL